MLKKESHLAEKKCIPCTEGVPPLKGEELKNFSKELEKGWSLINEHHLEKDYAFPDFLAALAFVNQVGKIAEQEGHHPDIILTWGNVKITLWTHKINGLSESDFILAAKCDKAFSSLPPSKPVN